MTTSLPVTDPAEQERARTIVARLEQGRSIHARFEQAVATRPARGSELFGDDEVTSWMHTSHVVTSALTMATDNIRALDGMMLVAEKHLVVPMYAHYPILRSVLEASALAKWILLPNDRKTRVTRLLRARLNDAEQDRALAKVKRAIVVPGDDEALLATLESGEQQAKLRYARDLEKIRSIANDQGILWEVLKSDRGFVLPWVHIIKAVSADAIVDPRSDTSEYAAYIWKVMSGLSHPSTTRTDNHSSMEATSTAIDGLIETRISASLKETVDAITIAWTTTLDAIKLLERRQSVP